MSAIEMEGRQATMERRREPRQQRLLSVNLFDGNNELLCERIQLRDLSLHGFSFETISAQFKPGDKFSFFLEIPEHGSVSGKARVCWCRSVDSDVVCMCGAEIQDMGLKNAGKLHHFMKPVACNVLRFLALTAKGLGWLALLVAVAGIIRRDLFLFDKILLRLDGLMPMLPMFLGGVAALLVALIYLDFDW